MNSNKTTPNCNTFPAIFNNPAPLPLAGQTIDITDKIG